MLAKADLAIQALRSIYSLRKANKDNFKTVPRPIALHFETTYLCTCKCVFCKRWLEGPKRVKEELTFDQIISMIDQAYELGVRLVTLSGGEPLLKKGILDAMMYAKKKGMMTNITDNGTLINEKNVDEILSAFDIINISLDSLDPKKHDKIRGVKGTFKKAMNSIRLLKKRSKGTVINVQSVLNSENLDDLKKMNKKFARMGIATYFQPLHDNPGGFYSVMDKQFKNFNVTKMESEWREFIDHYSYPNFVIKKVYNKYYDLALDFLINPNSTKKCFKCFAGSLSIFIDPYGNVYPCDPLRVSMGNIKDRSLRAIWHDKKSTELRRKITKNRACNCWLLCTAPLYLNVSKLT